MVVVVGIFMKLNNKRDLEFHTANVRMQTLLLTLLRRTSMAESGIGPDKNKIIVKRGNFLYTKTEKSKHVFFPYMVGKGVYGLYIVDDGVGDLVFMLMSQGSTNIQSDDLKLLEALERA